MNSVCIFTQRPKCMQTFALDWVRSMSCLIKRLDFSSWGKLSRICSCGSSSYYHCKMAVARASPISLQKKNKNKFCLFVCFWVVFFFLMKMHGYLEPDFFFPDECRMFAGAGQNWWWVFGALCLQHPEVNSRRPGRSELRQKASWKKIFTFFFLWLKKNTLNQDWLQGVSIRISD